MKLSKSQLRSLRGQVKWIASKMSGYLIYTHPTALTFMVRCGLVIGPSYKGMSIGHMTSEGVKVLT